MEQYLELMFGEEPGYVALASKGDDWRERQFEWPADKPALLRWVRDRLHTNIFVCPALRKTKARVKDDGQNLHVLWADVDWEKVPIEQRQVVRDRIARRATYLVQSGSGDNVHVYVELGHPVSIEQFNHLNQGLRDFLHADHKHPDNSLLRLPGTQNLKDGAGPVVWRRGNGKPVSAATLMKIPEIRDTVLTTKTDAVSGDWDTVDVSKLLTGRVGAMVRMDSDEARGRYGSRYGSVFQVATFLVKRGLTRNQIHSLMTGFRPGLEKEETERGYDMHADIDRCLSRQPTAEVVSLEEAAATQAALDENSPFSEPDAADVAPEDAVMRKARKLLLEWQVRDVAKQIQAQQSFTPPPDTTTDMWHEVYDRDEPEVEYLIEGLAGVDYNVTITGQYKAGKTVFVCNLIKALCEGSDFLGQFKTLDPQDGTVGFWSCEMTADGLRRGYLRPLGWEPEAAGHLQIWHGRGYGVNLMTDVGRKWAVNWLEDRDVTAWVIDSFARICSMCGVDENDNGAVLALLHRLDEIKRMGKVKELFLVAHTGRATSGGSSSGGGGSGGGQRARGATTFDDWADARWLLGREGNLRFFSLEGRDVVDMEPTVLEFDRDTKSLTLGVGDASGVASDKAVRLITELVTEKPGDLNFSGLMKILRSRTTGSKATNVMKEQVEEAIELGFIAKKKHSGREVRFWPVVSGRPEGGGASVRELDFSRVRDINESTNRVGRGRARP